MLKMRQLFIKYFISLCIFRYNISFILSCQPDTTFTLWFECAQHRCYEESNKFLANEFIFIQIECFKWKVLFTLEWHKQTIKIQGNIYPMFIHTFREGKSILSVPYNIHSWSSRIYFGFSLSQTEWNSIKNI